MVNSSLYKARIYVDTSNGNTYLYNKGTNWTFSPIDDNISDKMDKKGLHYNYKSEDREKHYFFTGLNAVATVSTTDLSSADLLNIVAGNTFTVTATGTGAYKHWDDIKAVTLGVTITITTATEAAAKNNNFDDLVNELNSILLHTNGPDAPIGMGGYKIMMDHFFEFFRFEENKIGFKTKEIYSDATTAKYIFQIADVIGTSISAGMKLGTGSIQSVKSKCQEDYEELQTIMTSGNDVDLIVMTSPTDQPSFQVVKINGSNITEGYINIMKVPEIFNPKGI